MKKTFLGLSILISCFYSCSDDNDTVVDTNTSISSIRFIGEQIIPDGFQFNGNIVGGLSTIDYASNKFYLISDAPNATDISTISSLKGASYIKTAKTLFDFEIIRDQLSSIPAGNGAKIVDNI